MGHATDNTAAPPDGWWSPEAGEDPDWLTWANSLPLCVDIGLRCLELTDTAAVFRMERVPLTPNPNGSVNGGIVAAAADQVMGALTMRLSEKGQLPATGSLYIQFHRPCHTPLTFRASCSGGGRRVKFIEVVVEDASGQHCSTSLGTMVVGGSSASPSPQAH